MDYPIMNSRRLDVLRLNKNAPNWASCSFDMRGLILIVFNKQHQHIFENDLPIQLSLSLRFCLLYLLLNSSDGNDAKRKRIFCGTVDGCKSSRRCRIVALKIDVLV